VPSDPDSATPETLTSTAPHATTTPHTEDNLTTTTPSKVLAAVADSTCHTSAFISMSTTLLICLTAGKAATLP